MRHGRKPCRPARRGVKTIQASDDRKKKKKLRSTTRKPSRSKVKRPRIQTKEVASDDKKEAREERRVPTRNTSKKLKRQTEHFRKIRARPKERPCSNVPYDSNSVHTLLSHGQETRTKTKTTPNQHTDTGPGPGPAPPPLPPCKSTPT